MEVLVLILVGIVIIGGLYQIVWDEIRKSRRADQVAQENSEADAGGEPPVVPTQQEADECTSSARPFEISTRGDWHESKNSR
jgi:hypothetical protein